MANANSTITQDELKQLDFASYRLSGSGGLCDSITLPLNQALLVIERMHESPDSAVDLIGVVENEIRDAQQVASKCRCGVEENAPLQAVEGGKQ